MWCLPSTSGASTAPAALARSTPCASSRRQRLRRRPPQAQLGSGEEEEVVPGIEKDSRVRVAKPITVFHSQKLGPFSLEGKEGTVVDVVKHYKGKELSATLPYKVQFAVPQDGGKDIKLITHLAGGELEKVG